MSSITAQLHISKKSQNNLSATKLLQHWKEITESCKNRQQANGVQVDAEEIITKKENNEYSYYFLIKAIRPVHRSQAQAQKAMENAIKFISRAADNRQWQCRNEADVAEAKLIAEDRPKFSVPDEVCPNLFAKYFKGIFERDSHVRVVHSSVVNAVKTNFAERNHCLLWGEPAVAKSILFKRFKAMYEEGSDIERIAIIDSTSTSKAGIENWLLDRAKDGILPEIICFDELEKCPEQNVQCLLQLMDDNCRISRVNSRIGRQQAEARPLIFGTCNNIEKLKTFASGALYSRFSIKLPCVRPGRDLMHKILVDNLLNRMNNGEEGINLKWADVVIEYAFDKMKCSDPRTIKGLLAGRDRLLDGSYQKDLEKINESYIKSSCETSGVV